MQTSASDHNQLRTFQTKIRITGTYTHCSSHQWQWFSLKTFSDHESTSHTWIELLDCFSCQKCKTESKILTTEVFYLKYFGKRSSLLCSFVLNSFAQVNIQIATYTGKTHTPE